jgi:hypothetical protein
LLRISEMPVDRLRRASLPAHARKRGDPARKTDIPWNPAAGVRGSRGIRWEL